MLLPSTLLTLAALTTLTTADPDTTAAKVPSLNVPACPQKGTIQYNKSVPNRTAFPLTQVDLCYGPETLHLTLTAYNESNYYYNASLGTNDAIYNYEVMEAFISLGAAAPQTYLEFEVAPDNVTYNAFVYNPSKVRAAGAPFDHFYIADPLVIGLNASTVLDRAARTWVSDVRIPLGLWNVDEGKGKGTQWRMNFFRTVVGEKTYPDQLLGGWSPPTDNPSFHETPFFGNVRFV